MILYLEFPGDLMKHAIYVSVQLPHLNENISFLLISLIINFFFFLLAPIHIALQVKLPVDNVFLFIN